MRRFAWGVAFLAFVGAPAWGQEELEWFHHADADGDRRLERSEIRRIDTSGLNFAVDRDGDGFVSLEEFEWARNSLTGPWPETPEDAVRREAGYRSLAALFSAQPTGAITAEGKVVVRAFAHAGSRYFLMLEVAGPEHGEAVLTMRTEEDKVEIRVDAPTWRRLRARIAELNAWAAEDNANRARSGWTPLSGSRVGTTVEYRSPQGAINLFRGYFVSAADGIADHLFDFAVVRIPGCGRVYFRTEPREVLSTCVRLAGVSDGAVELFNLSRNAYDLAEFSAERLAADAHLDFAWADVPATTANAAELIVRKSPNRAGEPSAVVSIDRLVDQAPTVIQAHGEFQIVPAGGAPDDVEIAPSVQTWTRVDEVWQLTGWEIGELRPYIYVNANRDRRFAAYRQALDDVEREALASGALSAPLPDRDPPW